MQEMSLYRSETTRGSDTADALLRRLNVADAAAAAFLRADPNARQLFEGRPGKRIQLRTDDFGRVHELVARYPLDDGSKFQTEFVRLRIERGRRRPALAASRPPRSCRRCGWAAARCAPPSSPPATTPACPTRWRASSTEMFSAEIDFHRGLKRGDSFTVLYEALTADGEPVAGGDGEEITGRVLAAEFVSRGRSHSAVWFEGARAAGDPAGPTRGGYFGLDGQGKRHAFLASPLEFSRITSGFEMRLHPILQTWREHRGVDYGAPDRHRGAQRRRRPGRVRRLAERLRQRGRGQAQQRPLDGLRAPQPDRRGQGPARRARRRPSAPSAPPAGPPARTCTSSSASRTRSRTRWRWRRPPRRC